MKILDLYNWCVKEAMNTLEGKDLYYYISLDLLCGNFKLHFSSNRDDWNGNKDYPYISTWVRENDNFDVFKATVETYLSSVQKIYDVKHADDLERVRARVEERNEKDRGES